MYAVIRTGGKQERVSEGDTLNVEKLGAEPGADVTFTPILLVDGDDVLTGDELGAATVQATVVAAVRGPKIIGFKYKNKSRSRKRWGHRQNYDRIQITGISKG
jgi:large subunit ribosomal protein L21